MKVVILDTNDKTELMNLINSQSGTSGGGAVANSDYVKLADNAILPTMLPSAMPQGTNFCVLTQGVEDMPEGGEIGIITSILYLSDATNCKQIWQPNGSVKQYVRVALTELSWGDWNAYTTDEEIDSKITSALTVAQESGEFDGYTPRKGVDYWTEEDKSEIVAQLSQVEAPKIVSSIAEMTDTTKHYVLQSTGRIYAHRTIMTGGEIVKTPNFTNLFDKSKVTLNAYLTGSAIGTEDGSFVTNIMTFDKANLAKPQVIRIANFPNALTAHKRSRIAFLPNGAYNGNTFCQFNSLLSGITVDTSNLGLQTVTIADGGTINSGSALTNTINSIQISLRMGASTLTLADIPDLIITVNEEITYTETTTPIVTNSEWYDTGISYTPTFKTDLIGVVGENNVIYLSDNNLPSGTYTLKYSKDDYEAIGTYIVE